MSITVPSASAVCSCQGAGAARPEVDADGQRRRNRGQDQQLAIHDRGRVREEDGQCSQPGAGQEEIREGARLDAVVEKLGKLPHAE